MISTLLPQTDTANRSGHCSFGYQSSLCNDPSLHLLHSTKNVLLWRPLFRNRGRCSAQKTAAVCFKDLDFNFNSVPETLRFQCLLVRKRVHHIGWRYNSRTDRVKRDAFWDDMKTSVGKAVSDKVSNNRKDKNRIDLDLPFVSDQSVDPSTHKGNLSAAAISAIEQFGRLVDLTGEQLKSQFYSHAPRAAQDNARNLVEYCCFYYLSNCDREFHPSIKDDSFRGLIFITMLAWQHPYEDNPQDEDSKLHDAKEHHEKQRTWVVGEDAFTRIAPAISGVADKPTAHHLYEALTKSHDGLTFSIWDMYLSQLLRVNEERAQHRKEAAQTLSLLADEALLCFGGTKTAPVQMWNRNNVGWPGRLTLTDRALYFEPNGILHHQRPFKISLAGGGASVQKKKVGPFGAAVLDSAIEIRTENQSESWVLEFVDFSGGQRREVWSSFINEIISVHSFIHEYGPATDDPSVSHVSGSEHGGKKALASALHGISRVQAVQSTLAKGLERPERLLQFSYSANAPCGELVLQSLAVHFWGGSVQGDNEDVREISSGGNGLASDDKIRTDRHVVDSDGSVYLQRWMKSPSWNDPKSLSFWKQRPAEKALSLGKELMVGEFTPIDKAVKICKEQSEKEEEIKLTVDGSMLKGIPTNIDLLKGLLLPFSVFCDGIIKLRKWENPVQTMMFLSGLSVIIYKRWLKFMIPVLLLTSALAVIILRILKWQGQLGSLFGRVTITEQPPSSTLQQLLALKDALEETELQIQKVNIVLLKLRTVALSGLPQATNKVILALLGSAMILAFVPFRYVFAFLIIDQFTYELNFRRGSVLKFESELKEWWQSIPAAPVTIFPHKEGDSKSLSEDKIALQQTTGAMIAEAVSEWFAEAK